MLNRYRTFLFCFFVILFICAAFSVIFYAYGYRFNLNRGIFVYTGSITIKSSPQQVTVKIDGEELPEKSLGILNNSILLTGIAPGEHFVEVSAPGYRTWSKKVVVQSGVSTEFWNVLLARETYVQTPFQNSENTVKIFPAPKTGLFASLKNVGNEYTVDSLDIRSNTDTQIFSNLAVHFDPDRTDLNIEWDRTSRRLIIPLLDNQNKGITHYIVDTENNNSAIILFQLVKMSPLQNVHFDPINQTIVFFLSGTDLYRVDLSLSQPTPELMQSDVRTYTLSGRSLFYINSQSGIIYRKSKDSNINESDQVTQQAVGGTLSNQTDLVVYDADRIAILDHQNGRLEIFNRNIQNGTPMKELLTSGVKGIQFSDDGKKLLYYTDNEISVYFYRDWDVQPVRTADSVFQVLRFSKPVKNVEWSEDYEHVIYSQDNAVRAAELDNRDRRNIADILTLPSTPLQIFSRFDTNELYIVAKKENGPETQVINVTFPEPQGLFGQ